MLVRLFRQLAKTKVEGPGIRYAVWTQGCARHCPGCALPQTWDFAGGYAVVTSALTAAILGVKGIEGVTFAGGEPFAQAAALAEIGESVRRAGLSVVTFTGFTLEELQTLGGDAAKLLAVTDLLLDGPYIQAETDYSRPWVGSRNQRFHFLTPRYRHLADKLAAIPNRWEIHCNPDGIVWANGMGDPSHLKSLKII